MYLPAIIIISQKVVTYCLKPFGMTSLWCITYWLYIHLLEDTIWTKTVDLTCVEANLSPLLD